MTDKAIRSPSHPNMSLRDAITAVRKIEAEYRTAPVDREDAAKLIGYSSLSGPAAKALAALAHYDLVERAGKGELNVSQLAVNILHPDSSEDKFAALQTAAFAPSLYRDLQDRWPGIVPPEEGVATYLRRQGFNEGSIRPAAASYLDTLELLKESKASESHGHGSMGVPESVSSKDNSDELKKFGGAKVGDLIQWESQGALQFANCQRVRAVSEDGNWVAVEGSETGIPMSQVIVEQAGVQAPPVFNLVPDAKANSIEEGEVEWMRNRVGSETTVRIMAKGDLGPREIGKLIKLLEAQKLVLEDE